MTEIQKETVVLTSMIVFRGFVGNKATRARDWTFMIFLMFAFHLMFSGLHAASIDLKSLSVKDLATY